MYVCFVCPIITYEPLDRFASKFYWGTWENYGNVLSLVLNFKLSESSPGKAGFPSY